MLDFETALAFDWGKANQVEHEMPHNGEIMSRIVSTDALWLSPKVTSRHPCWRIERFIRAASGDKLLK